MSILSSAKKKKIIAVLDIGSASVGGALVALGVEASTPTVLFSTRKQMVFQQDLDLKRFLSAMLSSLDEVLSDLQKSVGGKPESVFCVLSSPWYESETKILQMKEEKSFPVTRKLLEEFIVRESEAFRTEVGMNRKITEEIEVINAENIQTKLNGYETADPYGKQAHRMDVSFFVALASRKTLDAIRNRVAHTFRVDEVVFSAFSLAAFVTIRDIFVDKNNFLLLDITGEITDLALVRSDVLLETASFPMGKNFLIRRIASGLSTTPEGALSLLNMMRTNAGNTEENARLLSILGEARKTWVEAFTKALVALSKHRALPSAVFFSADPEVAPWFMEAIRTEEFAQYTTTDDVFDVTFLNADVLEKFCTFEKGSGKDPFLILESIFASRYKNL